MEMNLPRLRMFLSHRNWRRVGSQVLCATLAFNLSGAPALAAMKAQTSSAAPVKPATSTAGGAAAVTPQGASMQGLSDLISGGLFGGNIGFPQNLFNQVTSAFTGCGSTLNLSPCNQAIPDSFSADTSCDNESLASTQRQYTQGQAVLQNLQCKSSRIVDMQNEVTCLANEAQGLANTLGQLQQFFTNAIQTLQTSVNNAKAQIQDVQKQVDDANKHLNGSPDSQDKGLRAIKNDVSALVAAMPAKILSIKSLHTKIDSDKQSLEEAVATRRMALTYQCFSTDTNAANTCDAGGKAVSPEEYARCRYEQTSYNGQDNAFLKQQAAGKAAQLKALLDELFSQAPHDPNIPDIANSTAQDGAKDQNALDNQNRSVLNPDQIEAKYKKALQAYDMNAMGQPGQVNISSYVLGTIRKCYDEKAAQVDSERKMASSSIGKRQTAIDTETKQASEQVNEFVDAFSTNYNQATAALSGLNMPINTAACVDPNQTPAGQEKCLDDSYKNMKGMLEGSTQNSSVNFTVKGTNPSTYYTFGCQGLNGCIQKLENFVTNGNNAVTQSTTALKNGITSANQQLVAYKQQFVTALSPQSSMLDSRLQQLNGALAKLGVEGLIERKNVKAEDFESDDKFCADDKGGSGAGGSCLYKPPKSTFELIGGNLVPPMLDVRENVFQSAQTSMAKRVGDLGKNQADVAKELATLSGLHSKCERERKKEAKQDAVQNALLAGATGQKLPTDSGGSGGSAGGLGGGDQFLSALNGLLNGNLGSLGGNSGGLGGSSGLGTSSLGGLNNGLGTFNNTGGRILSTKSTFPGATVLGQQKGATAQVSTSCDGRMMGASMSTNPLDPNSVQSPSGVACSGAYTTSVSNNWSGKGGEYVPDRSGGKSSSGTTTQKTTGGGAGGSSAGTVGNTGKH